MLAWGFENTRDSLFRIGPVATITGYLELGHRIDQTKIQISLMNKPIHISRLHVLNQNLNLYFAEFGRFDFEFSFFMPKSP